MRTAHVPKKIDGILEQEWRGLSKSQKIELSHSILKLSDHFQNPQGLETPWEEFHQAYLFYFLPLNLARAVALFQSLGGLIPSFEGPLFDIGAGFGNLSILQQEFPELLKGPVTSIEKHPPHGNKLLAPPAALRTLPTSLPSKSVGFFSYSWVEMKTPVDVLDQFDTLVFLEPSTSVVARKIMTLRKELIHAGFKALAPCTHQKDCPLLIHSQKDWCHDRVHFEASSWFTELQEFLPMKNQSLTFSYLVMSKSHLPQTQGWTRVIGDTLKEKGKARQAICFDDQRRFLSWLKRDFKEIPHIDHGRLIRIQEGLEKGAELRMTEVTRIEEFSHDRKAGTL